MAYDDYISRTHVNEVFLILSILNISDDDKHLALCRGLPASGGELADHCLCQGSQDECGENV